MSNSMDLVQESAQRSALMGDKAEGMRPSLFSSALTLGGRALSEEVRPADHARFFVPIKVDWGGKLGGGVVLVLTDRLVVAGWQGMLTTTATTRVLPFGEVSSLQAGRFPGRGGGAQIVVEGSGTWRFVSENTESWSHTLLLASLSAGVNGASELHRWAQDWLLTILPLGFRAGPGSDRKTTRDDTTVSLYGGDGTAERAQLLAKPLADGRSSVTFGCQHDGQPALGIEAVRYISGSLADRLTLVQPYRSKAFGKRVALGTPTQVG